MSDDLYVNDILSNVDQAERDSRSAIYRRIQTLAHDAEIDDIWNLASAHARLTYGEEGGICIDIERDAQ